MFIALFIIGFLDLALAVFVVGRTDIIGTTQTAVATRVILFGTFFALWVTWWFFAITDYREFRSLESTRIPPRERLKERLRDESNGFSKVK